MISDEYDLPEGWEIAVADEYEVSTGDILAYLGDEAKITAQNAGRVRIEGAEKSGNGSKAGSKVVVSYESRQEATYDIPSTARMLVKDGERVEAGYRPLQKGH